VKLVVKIISIGNTCLDIILMHTNQLPEWSTERFFKETQWRAAGQGANFAIAAASLGHPTHLVSNIGSDQIGAGIHADLGKMRFLNLQFLEKASGSTGFTVSVVRSDGERLFLTFLGHQNTFSLLHNKRRILQSIQDNDIIHISGYYMLPKLSNELPSLIPQFKAKQAKISFDPGWPPFGFNKAERKNLNMILPHVDYFEPNETELQTMTGECTISSAVKALSRVCSGVVAVKRGSKGSITFAENRARITPAFKIRAIDSTGAGDVFDAAFLTGIIQDAPLSVCARRGNAAAAALMSNTNTGLSRFPKEANVKRFLEM
jgi:sugar/nucleoside kinase (ribokinase family)